MHFSHRISLAAFLKVVKDLELCTDYLHQHQRYHLPYHHTSRIVYDCKKDATSFNSNSVFYSQY